MGSSAYCALNCLWRLSERPDERTPHPPAISETVLPGNFLGGEATSTHAIVFANPAFNGPLGAMVTQVAPNPSQSPLPTETTSASSEYVAQNSRETELRGMLDMSFDPLNGTRDESINISQKFRQWRYDTNSFEGEEATKVALLNVQSPSILHLATHGFFEPEDKAVQPNRALH
jgi:hypothetical protein